MSCERCWRNRECEWCRARRLAELRGDADAALVVAGLWAAVLLLFVVALVDDLVDWQALLPGWRLRGVQLCAGAIVGIFVAWGVRIVRRRKR